MLGRVIRNSETGVLLSWTILASLVLLATGLNFFNDVYSTYWGFAGLADMGVVLGAEPNTTLGTVSNVLLAFGLSIVILFMFTYVGIIHIQIQLLELETETEEVVAELNSLIRTRKVVLNIAVILAIVDFITDISYRFDSGDGFSTMWQTPTMWESIVLGILITVGVFTIAQFLWKKYDYITNAVSSVIAGYVVFVLVSAYLGMDVLVYITFGISTIATIIVFTFGNEIVFSLSFSFLLVAIPILMENYNIKLGGKGRKNRSTKEVSEQREGLASSLSSTLAQGVSSGLRENTIQQERVSNSRGNRGNR